MDVSVVTLLGVFLFFGFRKLFTFHLEMWQIMLLGALIVVATGSISFLDAIKAINLDVMIFLFSMFVVARAFEESNFINYLFWKAFKNVKSKKLVLLLLIFSFGILSALIMNDTVAIIATPLVLLLSNRNNLHPKPLLFTLAFSVTIGSVFSPIGNPQNLLIATHIKSQNPFLVFFKYLFLPTIINFFVLFVFILLFFKEDFKNNDLIFPEEKIQDKELANISKISLFMLIIGIIAKSILFLILPSFDFKLSYIGILAMLPVLILSSKRFSIIKTVDYHTLIFFASMFVLMQSVWNSGFFQHILKTLNINVKSVEMIFPISIILSQFISNVPLVTLLLPLLSVGGPDIHSFLALASASTIAGNFFILGAASNVIIFHNAEKRTKEIISTLEFSKIGIPLTIINALIYYIFLKLF